MSLEPPYVHIVSSRKLVGMLIFLWEGDELSPFREA